MAVYNPSITLANFDADIQANGGVPAAGSAVLTAVNDFLFHSQNPLAVTSFYNDPTNSGSVTIPFGGTIPSANLLFGPGAGLAPAGPNNDSAAPTDQTITATIPSVIVLGPGPNTVSDPGGNWIFGGGGPGPDSITVTGTGDDSVVAGSAPTTIIGGTGSDFYWGGGMTSIQGGSGTSPETLLGGIVSGASDTLWGGMGTGNESIRLTQGNNYAQAGFGNATMFGGSGNDVLVSGNPDGSNDFATWMSAGSGNNRLIGGRFDNSHDSLYGGAGLDTLKLYQGDNTAIAGTGATTIYGGTGNDWLSGNTSPTSVSFASIVGGAVTGSHETLAGGYSALSQDTLWAGNGGGAATLSVTQGNNYLQGGFGPSLIEGGSGNDTLVSGNPGAQDSGSTLVAGSGNESLIAGRFSSSHDLLFGGAGNDTMTTSQGNNFLVGGSGNDTVMFNSGSTLNDYVSGQSGNVTIDVSHDETQVGGPVTNPGGSTSLIFSENGHTQTLTYSGPNVTVNFNT